MNDVTCRDCKFWRLGKDPGVALGECKRHAPKPKIKLAGKPYALVWPVTNHDDFCGEFEES